MSIVVIGAINGRNSSGSGSGSGSHSVLESLCRC